MYLTQANLLSKRESRYFSVLAALAALVWLLIIISIVGLFYALLMVAILWFANGLFVAHIRANSVEAHEQQFSALYKTFEEVALKLGVVKVPRLYVLQSEGALNAFATRHSGRDFVVVFSSLYETLGADSAEMRFLLGHELGHVKRKHMSKFLFLTPVSWIPLLGAAYRRSVEESCDRFGTFAAGSVAPAARAMTMLAAGKVPGEVADVENFARQYQNERGFFVSWLELASHYPTLSQRVHHILSLAQQPYPTKESRHPLSYFCAFLLSRAMLMFLLIAFYGGMIGASLYFKKEAKSQAAERPHYQAEEPDTYEEE